MARLPLVGPGTRSHHDNQLHGCYKNFQVRGVVDDTTTKDEAMFRRIIPSAVNPNGEVNVAGLRRDLAFFRELGLIEKGRERRRGRGRLVRESGRRPAGAVSSGHRSVARFAAHFGACLK
jgi:hypothetical protein